MSKSLWVIAAVLLVVVSTTVVKAVDPGGTVAPAKKTALIKPLPAGKEALIRQALKKNYPEITIESVSSTPLPGIYEIMTDSQLIYADEKAAYLFVNGSIIDTANKTNLTQERFYRLTAIRFDQLPLDLAFKRVKGNGQRKMAVFSDPDCPFCKKLEGDLLNIDNVTLYMFLYPIDALHPQASDRAKRIWCSPDRVKAWDDWLRRGIAPTATPACDNPVEKVVDFGNRYRINGTPTLIFADGLRVPGAISAEQIEQHLVAAQVAK